MTRPSPLWDWLQARGDEIGLHSHRHPSPAARFQPDEVHLAVEAYRHRFGRAPGCWRPPYGRLKPGESQTLRAAGIRRVSTFHGTDPGIGLEDRPVSRILGLPLALSWLRAVGGPMVRRFPTRAVLVMHLHDVVPTAARARLPPPLRAFYGIGDRHGDGLGFLARLLEELRAGGTCFTPLW